jgi:hypothetical protein
MSHTMTFVAPSARMMFVHAIPAAPVPVTTIRASSTHAQGVEQRREHDDRGSVLVVVEDGDVELPAADLREVRPAMTGGRDERVAPGARAGVAS